MARRSRYRPMRSVSPWRRRREPLQPNPTAPRAAAARRRPDSPSRPLARLATAAASARRPTCSLAAHRSGHAAESPSAVGAARRLAPHERGARLPPPPRRPPPLRRLRPRPRRPRRPLSLSERLLLAARAPPQQPPRDWPPRLRQLRWRPMQPSRSSSVPLCGRRAWAAERAGSERRGGRARDPRVRPAPSSEGETGGDRCRHPSQSAHARGGGERRPGVCARRCARLLGQSTTPVSI